MPLPERGDHKESLHSNQDHLFWVPDQLQTLWHAKPLLVREWDFIHLRLTKETILYVMHVWTAQVLPQRQ